MKLIKVLFLLNIISIQINGQDLYFPPNFSEEWEAVDPNELNWCEENIDQFNSFLGGSNTNACIILKDGKIALESYFNDFEQTSSWYWASAGKSLTATMIGILQEEGALDIDILTSEYLGEGWTNCSIQQEEKITLRHQLTMTTGFDYLGSDNNCIEPECLNCLNEPGEEWFYHNPPYTLLADVIESATDNTYTSITNSALANKVGFLGLWTNVESGRLFFSTARGMARFGLLMLNEGDWNGEEVIGDKDYLHDMINTSQDINKSYGYLWWLNGKESFRLPGTTFTFSGSIMPDAPTDLYAAIGKNGQILMVVPSENLVIVRMGNNPDDSLVPTEYLNELWAEYSKLKCTLSAESTAELEFNISPNPVERYLEVVSDYTIDNLNIYNINGQKIKSTVSNKLDLSSLEGGIYIIEVSAGNQSTFKKFIKR